MSAIAVARPELDRKGRLAADYIRYQHRQCYICWRLKHNGTGKPHGHAWPKLRGYSHGICAECVVREMARIVTGGKR